MEDKRLDRLEDKIDNVKEEVFEVKTQVVEMKSEMTSHINIIEDHVAGDKKIIDQLSPILSDLAEMVQDYKVTKIEKELLEQQTIEAKKIRSQKLKNNAVRVSIVGGVLAAALTLIKILEVI